MKNTIGSFLASTSLNVILSLPLKVTVIKPILLLSQSLIRSCS